MVLSVFDRFAVDENGDAVASPTVEVRSEITGKPLASLFSDRDGLTGIANPFTGDADGRIKFFVAGGAYQVEVTNGSFSQTLNFVAQGTAAENDSSAFQAPISVGAKNTLAGSDGSVLAFFGGVPAAKTGAYTVIAGDHASTILVDGSGGAFTVTLTAVATLAAGFEVTIIRTDSTPANLVTIDANGSETINGALTHTLRYQHQRITLVCTGSAWLIKEATPDNRMLLASASAAASPLDSELALGWRGTFRRIEVELTGIQPETDNVELEMQLSNDFGATYESAAASYDWGTVIFGTGSQGTNSNASDTKIGFLAGSTRFGNGATEIGDITFNLHDPGDSARRTNLDWRGIFVSQSSIQVLTRGRGRRLANEATNGIRFAFSSGNIARGALRVYGIDRLT